MAVPAMTTGEHLTSAVYQNATQGRGQNQFSSFKGLALRMRASYLNGVTAFGPENSVFVIQGKNI